MRDSRLKSEVYFHQPPEKLNCAQSILKGFQSEFNISEEKIAAFKAFGGGRVEGGTCGALFAAKHLLEGKSEELEEAFKSQLGHVECKALKEKKVECLGCVSCADQLVESFLHRT